VGASLPQNKRLRGQRKRSSRHDANFNRLPGQLIDPDQVEHLRLRHNMSMSRSARMRCTKRHYRFWLVALLLLLQQVAFATSICAPIERTMPAVATAATQSDCMHGKTGHLGSVKHCAQGTLVSSDARSPNATSVSMSSFAPLAPVALTVSTVSSADMALAAVFRPQATHPPLRLLFCSLLI